jgi:DNA-binding MarR family transcriptional regulator
MSDSAAVLALERLGNIRRQLNLAAVKLLRSHRLHPKQMVMLRFVYAHGEVSLTQLARGTATDMAAASRAIGPLIKQGWLKKIRDPDDSRRWIIELTAGAARRLPGIDKIYSKLARIAAEPLSPRERKELLKILTKMLQHLESKFYD